jgi:hypothetical protein
MPDVIESCALIDRVQAIPDRSVLEEFGNTLFQALFPTDVRLLYESAKARLEESKGLRLCLRLPDILTHLPWEFLYEAPFYLATDPRLSIVRFLELREVPQPLSVQPLLRVLLVISNPKDVPPLHVKEEEQRVRSTLQDLIGRKVVEIETLAPATLDGLRDKLRHNFHIFHYTGHGQLAETGYLLFEDDSGYADTVDADMLAQHLRGTTVRLVVLNACQTALTSGIDAFMGVAPALVQAGLPAVVAMQMSIPDSSALEFAKEFYKALADNYPIDAAMTEGRKAIIAHLGQSWRGQVDWGIPVLFMRVSDGHVLHLAKGAEEMAKAEKIKRWWDELPEDWAGKPSVGGDVIVVRIGDHARNVAAGKNVTQTIYGMLGEPQPDDRQVIEQKFTEVHQALQATRDQLGATVAQMAEMQIRLMQGELIKTQEDEIPSANTITMVGDWLLDNVPAIMEALTGLFATPAIGRVIGKAGETAVRWVKERLGQPKDE